ncbi:hypothetical protein FB451DRAFT_1564844 [Mycena latifolia]|nr:hypothetical protein FB451DRAFT_1564844 [Mycena latifolia]
MSKRPSSPSASGAVIKRAKGTPPPSNQISISSCTDKSKGLIRTVQRTSNLDAPIISLAGAHSGEILSCRFDPTGQNIAACSADRSVSLWRTYAPHTNYALFSSLAAAPITDLHWSLSSPHLYTVSADRTLTTTDNTTGQREHNGALVAVIERVMQRAVSLWEKVLSSLRNEPVPSRVELVSPVEWDEAPDAEELEDPEAWIHRCPVAGSLVLPDAPPEYKDTLGDNMVNSVELANSTIQAIVLTPAKLGYPGGVRYVEGMATESIVATFIYYYESEKSSHELRQFQRATMSKRIAHVRRFSTA